MQLTAWRIKKKKKKKKKNVNNRLVAHIPKCILTGLYFKQVCNFKRSFARGKFYEKKIRGDHSLETVFIQ